MASTSDELVWHKVLNADELPEGRVTIVMTFTDSRLSRRSLRERHSLCFQSPQRFTALEDPKRRSATPTPIIGLFS